MRHWVPCSIPGLSEMRVMEGIDCHQTWKAGQRMRCAVITVTSDLARGRYSVDMLVSAPGLNHSSNTSMEQVEVSKHTTDICGILNFEQDLGSKRIADYGSQSNYMETRKARLVLRHQGVTKRSSPD